MNSIQMPNISNPFVLAYLRIMNTNAPNKELQLERQELRQRYPELLADCKAHFAQCDEIKRQQLLEERTQVGEQAKAIIAESSELQQESGLHTSMQSRLQANLETAQRNLWAFTPRNRIISTLEQIEEDEAEETELRKLVAKCEGAIAQNRIQILQAAPGLKELKERYQKLADREEAIVRELEQLKLPMEERGPRSSIIWQDGANLFRVQLP